MKKANYICQIMRLKQIMLHWKHTSLRRRSIHSHSDSDDYKSYPSNSNLRAPSGFLGVYIGTERKRFVIPTRFLKLPVFMGLLKKSEEEFGLQCNGGLVLPCDVSFFTEITKLLKKDEHKYGKLSLEEFVKMFAEMSYCSCKENAIAFTPLLQKASSSQVM